MEGTLVGIGVLATVAVTGYTLVRYARRPVRVWGVLLGVLVAAIISSVFFPVYIKGHGSPLPVLIITSLCFSLAETMSVIPGWRRIALSAFTLLMLVALPWYAVTLVDGERYTGTPHTYTHTRDSLWFYLEDIKGVESKSYQVGWFSEMPFARGIPERLFWGQRITPHPYWHSPFTGLYRAEATSVAAWWPGGELEGKWWRKVEFRPREAPEE